MTLDRFYLIVEDAAWIERLVPLGVKLVQLRIKNQPAEHVRREVAVAKSLCARLGACLVVNDYWQCALEERCAFVHLGQTDLDGADVRALRRADIRIGISTHSHAELDRALQFDPDYIALGPIYPTMLKRMPWEPQGLRRIVEWKRLVGPRPLVAIGGITADRLSEVFAAGADSAAVVSDVCRHPAPEARVREWLTLCAKLR